MNKLDKAPAKEFEKAETWTVEIFGFIFFVIGGINLILPMIGISAYVDFMYSIGAIIIGLACMGKRIIVNTIKGCINILQP